MRELAAALYCPERGRMYPLLAIGLYLLGFAALLFMSPALVDPSGKPIGYDFITFWSAGHVTLAGRPELAFDMETIFAAQRLAVPGSEKIFLWHYPPMFQLVAAGLALMPYLLSYVVFMAVSLILYVAVLRHLIGTDDAVVLLLAYPGVLVATLHGQNSLLSTALLGAAILWLDKRPALAGVMIGLLAYKPQLGVLFPLVLALTGRWRTFAAAAVTAGLFAGISTILLGADLWRVFVTNTSVVREVMETGQLPWAKMPSAFIFLRMLGVGQTFAYAMQAVVAVSVIATVAWVWWRAGPTRLAGAALVTGTLLLPPYTFDYEMALLAVPLAILSVDLARSGATRFQKSLLLVLYVCPPLVGTFAGATSLQAGFFAILMLFCWCVRRALAEARSSDRDPVAWLPGRMFSTVN